MRFVHHLDQLWIAIKRKKTWQISSDHESDILINFSYRLLLYSLANFFLFFAPQKKCEFDDNP